MAIGKRQPRLFYVDTLQLQCCNLSCILVIYVNLISLFICISARDNFFHILYNQVFVFLQFFL